MRFRLGLALGLAAGYVFGTRAGRERYQEILQWSEKLRGSETARQLEGAVKSAWDTAREEFGEEVAEGIHKVTEAAKEKLGRDDDDADDHTQQGSAADADTQPLP